MSQKKTESPGGDWNQSGPVLVELRLKKESRLHQTCLPRKKEKEKGAQIF